jgi:DNA adenine methylase
MRLMLENKPKKTSASSSTRKSAVEVKPTRPKPFLKWAGGKRQLLDELLKRLPAFVRAYHEPFLGGGALFFELAARGRFQKAYLSDLNADLIEAYVVVQTWVEDLIVSLKKHEHSKEYFYRIRSVDPASLDIIERASRLIYLNRTCYNGLYRVNSKGEFNVPFGNYKNPLICDEDNLRLCSEALKGVTLRHQAFYAVMRDVTRGDFIYFDPPYHPVSKTASFSTYEKSGFGEDDHRRLKDIFAALDRKKCFVMLSNSYTPFTRRLFKEYKPETVEATRVLNSKSSGRGVVNEILVRNYKFSAAPKRVIPKK